MTREEALRRLRSHEDELSRLGVRHLFLFGSVARDEAQNTSDVDLFFDYDRGSFSLFQLMDVKDFASQVLGSRADIMTRDSLHDAIRHDVELSAVQVF